jgi:hypothetical protein
LVNLHKPWGRLCRRASLDHLRIHDLRHSYASVAVGAGVGLYLTGKILGHLRNTTTERYAHLSDNPIRQANELIGRRIADAMQGNQHDVRSATDNIKKSLIAAHRRTRGPALAAVRSPRRRKRASPTG